MAEGAEEMEKNNKQDILKSKCIILTTLCNNNCRNCLLDKRINIGYRSLSSIKKELYFSLRKGYERVMLLGGEPTIHPDFLEIIRLSKEAGYKKVTVLSNGRMFSYIGFLRKAKEAGLEEIIVSIYSHKPKVQDYITGTKGSLKQTLNALVNIKKLNYPLVVGTVITKRNYKDLPALSAFLSKLGINQHQFEFIRPCGMAWDNYTDMVPRMKEVVDYLTKALENEIKNNVEVRIEGMPFCVIENYSRYINKIEQEKVNDISEKDIKDHVKFKSCKLCRYNKVCVGVWKEYAEKEGSKEFIPVKF